MQYNVLQNQLYTGVLLLQCVTQKRDSLMKVKFILIRSSDQIKNGDNTSSVCHPGIITCKVNDIIAYYIVK